ncbi:hypothetical protein T05_8760, partial [Trichinella murrelli]
MKFYCEKVGGVSGEIGSTPILPVLDATDTIVQSNVIGRREDRDMSQEQHPDDFWDVLESVSPVVYTLHSFLL